MKQIIRSNLKVLFVAGCLVLAQSAFAADTPGSLTFNTRVAGLVDAKVSRPDGSGAGAGVQAQLFLVGANGSLIGLTPATTFRTDSDAASYYVDPVTVNTSSGSPGQQITLRMRAWAGASFENSSLSGESANFSVILGGGLLPPANLTGLTSFSLKGSAAELVTITASAGANGSISPSGTMAKNKGASVTFSATANSGFVVDKWTVNGTSVQNGGTSFTLANVQANRSVNVSFKASLAATITITATAGPNGSINPAGTITKPKGESQSFTAAPANGYAVEKWSVNGNVVQIGGATFRLGNVQENRSVLVTFNKQEITFTITAVNGANGSISPSGTIVKSAGESQLFVATPNSRYTVDKWIVDGRQVQSGGNTFKLEKIEANHDVSVSFRSTSLAGAGYVLFSTLVAGVVDAKVSRPDGTGAGEGAAAQLVLITKEGRLVPLSPRTTFRTSSEAAAYYVNSEEVAVPGFAPGQEVTLRMLAWLGESFDRAKLRGQSKDLKIMLGGGILPPSNLTGLEGFTLNAPTSESMPLIVEQPKSVNARRGSIVSFSVKAVGGAPLTYQWKYNGTAIDGATSPTLTLKPVKASDEGNYTAVVSNSIGSTTSSSAHLNVTRRREGGDFDNDGNPDILLISRDRTLAFWLMNGINIRVGLAPYKLGEGWKIVGTGDFNRDGKTDVLLQNEDGSLAFWLMEGTSITEGLVPLRLPDGWQVAATGDFNNDDQTDILLQDRDAALAFWLMDGTTVSQVVNASFKLPEGCQIIGAGDFNNDGETDILLRHSSRSLAFWLMEGTTIKEGLTRLRVPEGWQVIGLGDFNHDGQTDIMLRHSDRWLAFWFMNGMDITAGEVPMKQPEGWEVVGKD